MTNNNEHMGRVVEILEEAEGFSPEARSALASGLIAEELEATPCPAWARGWAASMPTAFIDKKVRDGTIDPDCLDPETKGRYDKWIEERR